MTEADNSSNLGVNLIAYIRAEMGLGTAARGIAHALESAGVPFNVLNFEHSNPALHRDDSWRHKESHRSSYDFTVLAINPDELSNATARAQKELGIGVELTAANRLMLYIPKDFAHGFQTLENNTDVFYQMSDVYVPEKQTWSWSVNIPGPGISTKCLPPICCKCRLSR
jgi:hypothetical protein